MLFRFQFLSFTYLYNDFFQEFRRIDKVPQNEVSTEKDVHQITGEDMAQSKAVEGLGTI